MVLECAAVVSVRLHEICELWWSSMSMSHELVYFILSSLHRHLPFDTSTYCRWSTREPSAECLANGSNAEFIFSFLSLFILHRISWLASKTEDNADWNCMRQTAITIQLSTGIWLSVEWLSHFSRADSLRQFQIQLNASQFRALFAWRISPMWNVSVAKFARIRCENVRERKQSTRKKYVCMCVCVCLKFHYLSPYLHTSALDCHTVVM